MGLQPVTVDGNTSTIFEHTERTLEVLGLPIGGWTDATGGGIEREGQTHMFGAGGTIRGTSNGRPVPQELTLKMAPDTWLQFVKPALVAAAASRGIRGNDRHQKVEFVLVDQWAAVDVGQKSVTIRTTVKIKSEKPDTPNDGNPFGKELVLKPVGLPEEDWA